MTIGSRPPRSTISIDDFLSIEIRAGTIISAKANEKARLPAYIIEIDFGSSLGTKTTSAQVTEDYSADELAGRQVLAVVNLPVKRVAGVNSEVLLLAIVEQSGRTVLAVPHSPVENGSRLL